MGAPGYYILCQDGHVIGMIEDDLYWGEPADETSVWKELETYQEAFCFRCGKLAKYEFCHYGNINDCLDRDNKITWNSHENRYIIPKNHKGNIILRSKPCYVKAPKSTLDVEDVRRYILYIYTNTTEKQILKLRDDITSKLNIPKDKIYIKKEEGVNI